MRHSPSRTLGSIVLVLTVAVGGKLPNRNARPLEPISALPPVLPQPAVTTSPMPSPQVGQPAVSPVISGPTWIDYPLIDPTVDVAFPNQTAVAQQTSIYHSNIVLDTETRWIIQTAVDPIKPVVGNFGTGLLIQGLSDKKSGQTLYLVYHLGMWAIGYARSQSGYDYVFWQDFASLNSPRQRFELSISADGYQVSLKNDQGFDYQQTLSERLFSASQTVVSTALVGPQTRLMLLQLTVRQLRSDVVADPGTIPAPSGEPTPLPPDWGSHQTGYGYAFHVAVNGNDSNPGTADQPFASVEHARDVVRTLSPNMQGPIVVYLQDGTYFVNQPIQFGLEDSGQNGYDIIYRAANGASPVLSGGILVAGWHLDSGGAIWKTTLPDVKGFRQLYVNGVRAQRAYAPQGVTGIKWAKGDTSDQDGIVVAGGQVPALARPQDLELHWIYDWRDMRLPVRSIQDNADGTKTIWMRQPFFSNALSLGAGQDASQAHTPKYSVPFYMENAIEWLNQPGEWYFNSDSHELSYWPRAGENLSTAQAVIPQTESLMVVAGRQAGQEVHNLAFEGLTFAYAGWTRASEVGTFGWQAQELLSKSGGGPANVEMTPAHVQVSFAHDVRFTGDKFQHLGAVALSLGQDAFHNTVQGNLFRDVSDSALTVGTFDDAYITAPAIQVAPSDDLIADNLIQSVGVEYWGAPAIVAYYVSNLTIAHNEIADVPYSGISLGWGWALTPASTTSHGNQVTGNLVANLNLRARDGGGIYTLGQQPGTLVAGNVVRNVVGDYACLYPDEGSAFIVFRDNVCDNAPRWLHIWTGSIHDITLANSYVNVSAARNDGSNITIQNTVATNGQPWPAAAQAIIDQAGLEPAYKFLRAWIYGP